MKIIFVIGSIAYAFLIMFIGKFLKSRDVSSDSDLKLMVAKGGGRWVGIQEVNEKYDLVLFNSPNTGSTLALKVSEISAAKVAQRIEESDASFNVCRNS